MADEMKAITLPSGKAATIRKGKGRDLMRAHRAVAGNPEPMAVSFALVAELAHVEGRPIVYEDLLAMDLEDVLALEAEVMGAAESEPNFTVRPADRGEEAPYRERPQSSD
jgi:hypothetical protein